jgi:type I restriction enzyme R subunit
MEELKTNDSQSLSSFIWKIANVLWGDFKHTDFARIIIPFLLLRRLECVLEPTKETVLKEYAREKDAGLDLDLILPHSSGFAFYNTSEYSLATLGGTNTRANLEHYVSHFSANVRLIFEEFGFDNTIHELHKAGLLYHLANKFQTGFNQPKLVAMYLDKKVSGVEAVQTLSRLNRTYPGKDETYVIDFVNDQETILTAFKTYDEGAQLETVQDLDVVYDMKDTLDEAHIYSEADLVTFMKARGKALKEPPKEDALQKKLYAATQRPTDIFHNKLKVLSEGIEKWDHAIDKAIADGDDKGRQQAETKRSELTREREGLMLFKTNLARFVRVYNYIAQLIELGDASLENFAAFAKLFSKRLKGVSPEQIDLTGLVLAAANLRKVQSGVEEPEPEKLKPIGPETPEPSDREKEFIREIIKRMNDLFGDVSDDPGHRHFTAQITQAVKNNPRVREQVEKNTRQQALQGDLPDAVKQAIYQARKSHEAIASVLLKDAQNMEAYMGLIYDLMTQGDPRDLID